MGLPSLSGPAVPVSATIAVATGAFVVYFDRPLQAGSSAAANWYEAYSGTRWRPGVVSAAGSICGGVKYSNQGPSTYQRITYLASPADLTSGNGLPVAAFVINATLV